MVNTGEQAAHDNDLRGQFEKSEDSVTRWENTKYTGAHWVEAFVVNNRTKRWVGKSDRFFIVVE